MERLRLFTKYNKISDQYNDRIISELKEVEYYFKSLLELGFNKYVAINESLKKFKHKFEGNTQDLDLYKQYLQNYERN